MYYYVTMYVLFTRGYLRGDDDAAREVEGVGVGVGVQEDKARPAVDQHPVMHDNDLRLCKPVSREKHLRKISDD